MIQRASILGSLLGILIVPAHVSAAAIVGSSQASQEVIIENVTASDSSVGGTVVNNSSKTFRNVVLLIRQDWLWNDERNPAPDSPGRTLSFIHFTSGHRAACERIVRVADSAVGRTP